MKDITKDLLEISDELKDIPDDAEEFDVFISYSSKDTEQVKKILEILKDDEKRCWFAPSDNGSGPIEKNIVRAIKNSKAFMLVLSPASQESEWVEREMKYALAHKIRFFPVVFEEFEIDDSIEFMLNTIKRYEAYAEKDEALARLIEDLNNHLKQYPKPRPVPKPTPPDKDTENHTVQKQEPKKREEPQKEEPPKKLPLLWIGISAAVIALAVMLACIFFLGDGQGEITSGSYLIWNPKYEVGLSGLTSHDYYLAGHVVQDKQVMLRNYPSDCVWQVDVFTDGTVIISQNGQNLGVIPGYTGVGLGGDHTADRWVLEDAGDGLYLIRNEELNMYLQWYAEKDNWSAYGNVSDSKRDTFLLELRKAG